MSNIFDKVHTVGMSPNATVFMEVGRFTGPDNRSVAIKPPLTVMLEGEAADKVAFYQDGLAARYTDEELRHIGEGSSALGMRRIIGDIAMNGNLIDGATKPLHPELIDGEVVAQPALSAAPLAITAGPRQCTI